MTESQTTGEGQLPHAAVELARAAMPRRNNRHAAAKITERGVHLVDSTAGLTIADLTAIQKYQESAEAESTKRGFETDWAAFIVWCAQRKKDPLPAEPLAVAAFITWTANVVDEHGEPFYAPGTISRRLTSINKAHVLAGHPKPGDHPDVARTIAGVRRVRARRTHRKEPLLVDDLKNTVSLIDQTSWPAGVIGHRDVAILTIGLAGAFRRSELAAIKLGDVRRHREDGLHIAVLKSKTDQEGRGQIKAIPFGENHRTCPPCAFARWVRLLAADESGRSMLMRAVRASPIHEHVCREPLPELAELPANAPLFRPVTKTAKIIDRHLNGQTVNDMLKRRVEAAGYNAADFGGHSLRAGFVTQAFRNGATHHEIMRQTWHKEFSSVDIYAREQDPLRGNAVNRLKL
ncbi:site-specific integrase [Agromyces sp. NPDC057679]|uniref:site-specific integrase n=1 Tax=Agromyces sp. NPDC057679 TaxID=3346207 RepID=UPI00366E8C10